LSSITATFWLSWKVCVCEAELNGDVEWKDKRLLFFLQ